MPPALSATGPYASTPMVMAVLESMPVAARPTPNRPTAMPPSAAAFGNAMLPKVYAPMMASATSTMGAMVDSMPVPMPSMMTVAAPVSAASAILWTGLYLSEQKYSVILPMARPAIKPHSTEPNSHSG